MSSSSCSFSNSGSSSSSAIYTPADVKKISGDEAQIYDRQIRLWGLEAQNRLRNSAVLLVGMSGLGAEIAKNLMLSGLKALTLMDDQEVTNNTSSQFLIPPGSNGKNRAEASLDRVKVLNPMVEVSVDTGSVGTKPEQFFRDFDLVILVDQDYETANSVNKICRKQQTRFQAAGVFGWLGYAFFDFNNHTFLLPKPKEAIFENLDDDDEDKNGEGSSAKKARTDNSHCPVPTLTLEEEADTKVRKNVPFPSFEQTFGQKLGTKKMSRRRFTLPASYFVVRAFLRLMKEKKAIGGYTKEEAVAQWKQELEDVNLDENKQKFNADNFALFVKAPLNPVCAIVGSVLSQEAIKALSQNDVPLKNVFLYSALDSSGCICDVSA